MESIARRHLRNRHSQNPAPQRHQLNTYNPDLNIYTIMSSNYTYYGEAQGEKLVADLKKDINNLDGEVTGLGNDIDSHMAKNTDSTDSVPE